MTYLLLKGKIEILQSVSSIVVELWHDLPTSIKNLNTFTFSGKVKEFLFKLKLKPDSQIQTQIMPKTAFICVYFLS